MGCDLSSPVAGTSDAPVRPGAVGLFPVSTSDGTVSHTRGSDSRTPSTAHQHSHTGSSQQPTLSLSGMDDEYSCNPSDLVLPYRSGQKGKCPRSSSVGSNSSRGSHCLTPLSPLIDDEESRKASLIFFDTLPLPDPEAHELEISSKSQQRFSGNCPLGSSDSVHLQSLEEVAHQPDACRGSSIMPRPEAILVESGGSSGNISFANQESFHYYQSFREQYVLEGAEAGARVQGDGNPLLRQHQGEEDVEDGASTRSLILSSQEGVETPTARARRRTSLLVASRPLDNPLLAQSIATPSPRSHGQSSDDLHQLLATPMDPNGEGELSSPGNARPPSVGGFSTEEPENPCWWLEVIEANATSEWRTWQREMIATDDRECNFLRLQQLRRKEMAGGPSFRQRLLRWSVEVELPSCD